MYNVAAVEASLLTGASADWSVLLPITCTARRALRLGGPGGGFGAGHFCRCSRLGGILKN